MSYFLYAETAFHHQGDFNYLSNLISAAAHSGVHGIKFQILLDIDEFMSSINPSYPQVKEWLLTEQQWNDALTQAVNFGLEIVAMPLDKSACNFIDKYPIKYLEVHSVSFCDCELLRAIKATTLPVILGIGGRTKDEIDEMLNFFGAQASVLMSGFQSFPTKLSESKIQNLPVIKHVYPELLLGYADHTHYSDEYSVKSTEIAFLLGATLIEKHLTLKEGNNRVDSEAAIEPNKLVEIKICLDILDNLMNKQDSSLSKLNDSEINYRKRQKIIVAKRLILAGHVLEEEDVVLKVTGLTSGLTHKSEVVGRQTKKKFEQNEIIVGDDLE